MPEETKENETVWLDFDTVMARLTLKRPELYRLVKDGKLKAEKKDQLLRFSETVVVDFDTKRNNDEKVLLDAIVAWEVLLSERFPIPKKEEAPPTEAPKQEEAERVDSNSEKDKPIAETPEVPTETNVSKPTEVKVDVGARVKALVDQLVRAGIREGITDLYVDPLSVGDRILFRYGDALVNLGKVEACLSGPLRVALREFGKIANDDDVTKRRGIVALTEQEQGHQILIEIAPTRLGDHVHIHYWGADKSADLSALGYSDEQANLVMNQLAASGCILIARGVGAFDDLHHVALGRAVAESNLVVSCETGIFPKSEHLVQVTVNAKDENGLATALDTALGLEPDVLMIDLVSKPEELKALFAILSMGGVVVAGVRALDMADVFRRFAASDIETEQLQKWLSFGIERAWVRRLCPDCKTVREMTDEEKGFWKTEKEARVCEPVGCVRCQNGYLDRRGIFGIRRKHLSTDCLGAGSVIRKCLLDGEISETDARQVYARFGEVS
jgi:type II secretory ATPase GspE/PulE/Tfp pilus assembly ATPase PilB-like protein